ncbi:MAG TPA: AMP-binding protein [Jatrophihabitans sp.]|nr:AMP-binding protein [Jatrophihabitans sp.]
MKLSPSAHVDTFCRDHLPPPEQWPQLIFELPELHYPERLNCAEVLLDEIVATQGADRPAVLSPTETWSYGELLTRANQLAHYLVDDAGLPPGQRVLLRGPNNPWLVACWFAVLKAGGVVVATVPLLRSSELTALVELTRATIALCDHRFTQDLAPVAAAGNLTMLQYGGPDESDLTRVSADKPTQFANVATAADDVALLAATSGTTGTPKATMHFHRDVLAIADTFGKYQVQGRPDDIFTGTPPLAFTFGLGGLLVFPMRVGAATLLIERATPVELAELVERFGATVLSTAPTAYRAILRAGQHDRLRSIRRAISAGEHLPKPVWEEMHDKTGIRLIDGIGSTEMLHVFISAADADIRPGSTGREVPGYHAAVLDAEGNPVPDGTAGRLAVIGPTGCRYLADPRQANYVQHGWNITGDTYTRDADGYFWYQARSDDMIVSSGYNIAAPEVERALEQHPDVLECAVVARPDLERGSIVHAAVVLREGAEPDAAKIAELQEFTKQAIAPYKYPRSIEFVTALPRTATGKLQRYRLREPEAAR